MHDNVLRAIENILDEIKTKPRERRPLPREFMCSECDQPAEHYMVHDHIWKEAFDDPSGISCIDCLQARLNHDLTYTDFKPSPINLSILRGMAMGGAL